MKAVVVTDQAAGTAGMKLMERPEPQGATLASLSGANYGDVVVQVHASGFTGERPMSKRARACVRTVPDATAMSEQFRCKSSRDTT
jgi:hypothetical protein